ncbi:hypothetical protein BB561_004740 [Smittium simulii]|uniref:UDP-N-acetylglucosamine diphosphorylase n=1 Tax=Smittium simulii TaxID=133385 RepID=A0A2T9YEG9_9FUNG|nr:hypothetical protein BB561_004740 [Smittium simulii]
MVPEGKLSTLRSIYTAAGQGHIFNRIESLSQPELDAFIETIEAIDIENVVANFNLAVKRSDSAAVVNKISPLDQSEVASEVKDNPETVQSWYNEGLKKVADNQVAAIVMAGGQGTRLGSSRPKGCYDVDLPSKKSLFNIQADRILGLQKVAAQYANKDPALVKIFWLVMVSDATREDTIEYFKSMHFFGLDESQISFFEQGSVPSFTFDGKLIMNGIGDLALSPDGNGGIYKGLLTSKVYTELKTRNIQYFHVYSVDNILVRVADPWLIGYSALKNAEFGALALAKQSWDEKVGVICRSNGNYKVVEYSEIPEDLAKQTRPDGSLYYNAANICNHFFTMDFLERSKTFDSKLPFHIAIKKIKNFDYDKNELISPDEPNGIKLERFIFDVLQFCTKISILDVCRLKVFSPLKNAPGTGADCPETSRADLVALHVKFAEDAGATIEGDARSNFEISHSISYFGEGLESLKGRLFLEKTVLQQI